MFNSLRYSKELEGAGFTREQAEATIGVFYKFMEYNFTTKEDHKSFELALRSDMKHLRSEMKEMETSIRTDMKEMEASIRSDMNAMEASIRSDIKDIRADMKQLEYRMTIKLGLMQAASIAILVTVIKLI